MVVLLTPLLKSAMLSPPFESNRYQAPRLKKVGFQSAFLNGTFSYDTHLLSLESPTPRARTDADRPSESSREVTLVAEATL
jgi:hypothetical protein